MNCDKSIELETRAIRVKRGNNNYFLIEIKDDGKIRIKLVNTDYSIPRGGMCGIELRNQ